MKQRLSTIPLNEWPIESWRNLVEKIDRMRDELDTMRADFDDAGKPNVADPLAIVVRTLSDLTFWAHCPDPEPLPDGWLDATKSRLQSVIRTSTKATNGEPKIGRILRDVRTIALEFVTAMATRTVETAPPVVEEVQAANVQPIDPSDISRTLLAIGDDVAAKVMTAVNDGNLDLEQKLTAISALDKRYYAWKSPKLGELLRRTGDRIRQTIWWRGTRKEWLADQRDPSDGVSDD